jgi:hypothetical protein
MNTRAVHDDQGTVDLGVAEAHRRFGGVDFPATLAGKVIAHTRSGGIVRAEGELTSLEWSATPGHPERVS